MKIVKITVGILLIAIGLMVVLGMAALFQQLLISSSGMISGLGSLVVEDEAVYPEATPEPDWEEFLSDSAFDGEPVDIPESQEELISIPVEQTAEELAKENETANNGG